MTYPNFTAAQLESEIRLLAQQYPNYVYQGDPSALKDALGKCWYSKDNNPNRPSELSGCGCIFGTAFKRLGFSADDLLGFDNQPDADIFFLLDITLDKNFESYNWFLNVQRSQDQGNTWSQAVARADAVERAYNGDA